MIQRVIATTCLSCWLTACGGGEAAGRGGGGGTGGAGGTGGVEVPVCDDGFTACGGDPLGTWTFDQACGQAFRLLDLAAPEACQQLPSWWATRLEGNLTFRDDGTAVEDYDGEQTLAVELPIDCLQALDDGPPAATCVAVGRAIVDREEGFGGCTLGTDERCACEITVPATFERTRTWEVAGGTLTLDGTVSYEVCVGDGFLVRRQDDGDGGHVVDVLVRVP